MGKDKERELIQLTKFGDFAAIAKILNKPKYQRNGSRRINLNYLDEDGLCALHHAARFGHIQLVQLLLERGAHADMGDARGYRALHHAAVNGHINAVTVLLRFHANVNAPASDGVTALHIAAYTGKVEMVKLLCEVHGACVTMATNQLKTPLDVASEQGQYDVVQYLLRFAPVQKLLTGTQTGLGASDLELFKLLVARKFTPLHYAARGGHVDVLALLLRQPGVNINCATARGTAMHEAAGAAHYHVVKFLCEHGADVTVRNELGLSALDVAHKAVAQVNDPERVSQLKCIVQLLTNEDFAKTVGNQNLVRRANRKDSNNSTLRRVQRAQTVAASNRASVIPMLNRSQQALPQSGSDNNALVQRDHAGSITSLTVMPTYGNDVPQSYCIAVSASDSLRANSARSRADYANERSQSVDFIPNAADPQNSSWQQTAGNQLFTTSAIRLGVSTLRRPKTDETYSQSQADCSTTLSNSQLPTFTGFGYSQIGAPTDAHRTSASTANLRLSVSRDVGGEANNDAASSASPTLSSSTNTLTSPTRTDGRPHSPCAAMNLAQHLVIKPTPTVAKPQSTQHQQPSHYASGMLMQQRPDSSLKQAHYAVPCSVSCGPPDSNSHAQVANVQSQSRGVVSNMSAQSYALITSASVPVMNTQVLPHSGTSDNSISSGFSSGTASTAPNCSTMENSPNMIGSDYEYNNNTLTKPSQSQSQSQSRPSKLNVANLLRCGTSEQDALYLWLGEHNLKHHFQLLVDSGFDWSTFSTIRLEDLRRLGLDDDKQLRSLHDALRTIDLRGYDPLAAIYDGITWPQKDLASGLPIATWMRSLGALYEQYSPLLLQQGYYTVQQMMKDDFMAEEDLKAFGIEKPGHARKIIVALSKLREKFMLVSGQTRSANVDLFSYPASANDQTHNSRSPKMSGNSFPSNTNAMKSFGKRDDFPDVNSLLNNITALSSIPPNRYEHTSSSTDKKFQFLTALAARKLATPDYIGAKHALPATANRAASQSRVPTNGNGIGSMHSTPNGLPKGRDPPTVTLTQPDKRPQPNTLLPPQLPRPQAETGQIQAQYPVVVQLNASQANQAAPNGNQAAARPTNRFVDDVILKRPVTDKSLEQYTIPPPPPPKPLLGAQSNKTDTQSSANKESRMEAVNNENSSHPRVPVRTDSALQLSDMSQTSRAGERSRLQAATLQANSIGTRRPFDSQSVNSAGTIIQRRPSLPTRTDEPVTYKPVESKASTQQDRRYSLADQSADDNGSDYEMPDAGTIRRSPAKPQGVNGSKSSAEVSVKREPPASVPRACAVPSVPTPAKAQQTEQEASRQRLEQLSQTLSHFSSAAISGETTKASAKNQFGNPSDNNNDKSSILKRDNSMTDSQILSAAQLNVVDGEPKKCVRFADDAKVASTLPRNDGKKNDKLADKAQVQVAFDDLDKVLCGIANELNVMLQESKVPSNPSKL